jgi:hypothetical protein
MVKEVLYLNVRLFYKIKKNNKKQVSVFSNTYFPLSVLGRRLSSFSVSDEAAMSVAIEIDRASWVVSRSSRGVSKGFNSGCFFTSSSSSSKKSRCFFGVGRVGSIRFAC